MIAWEDGELVDEAAELLASEMAGCRQELSETIERCRRLEAENGELRTERERRGPSLREELEVGPRPQPEARAAASSAFYCEIDVRKLQDQKHELQERLKQSEQHRQALHPYASRSIV